ncbi:MAG: ATPase [Bradyrhizobiaceae bacterium]|nr:MAG: ATPase [Bradyrhizobiaceae bacterium]
MDSGHLLDAARRLRPSSTPLGTVLSVAGSQAHVRLQTGGTPLAAHDARATVGKFLGIRAGGSQVVGVITKISAEPGAAGRPAGEHAVGQVDLLGEIKQKPGGGVFFQRGVTEYPVIGDAAELITQDELRVIFNVSGSNVINVGDLQQDHTIPAYINVDEMVRKHFAILGTTGVGKSTGVALLMRSILDARPDLRVFLIDPHNEYGHSFDRRAQVLSPKNLKLPFWLFNFEEIVDVFFRGRPGVEEEVEILADLVPLAKVNVAGARGAGGVRRADPKGMGITVDTPVPYMLNDLVALIEERMGKLENRSTWTKYHRLITRIDTVRNDPRYAFMFDNANVGGDTMAEALSQLFRLPPNGVPMTIMQLAGFPGEVVDSVVSVLCRMAFEFGLWSDGAFPLLVVCEEAHRYAPADRSIGFGPTRKAVSRIAKEGRKYGVYLGLITQRPAELDATIISQCSTLFAMRMANDRDQAIVRSAVSDAAGSLLGFVPSLGTREVFAFGEGVALPTRLRFKELPAEFIPKSESVGTRRDSVRAVDEDFLSSVVERWRGATMRKGPKTDDVADLDVLATKEFSQVRQRVGSPPPVSSLLKPGALDPDSYFHPVQDAAGRPVPRLKR